MTEQTRLTDAQIDEIFNSMPDGPAGFLKTWGYRQFARAIEQKAAEAERKACAAICAAHENTDALLDIWARDTGGEG